jgi:hypothetical protein
MSTLTLDAFSLPTTHRQACLVDEAWRRAAAELAGHTVWGTGATHELMRRCGVEARLLGDDLAPVGPQDVVVLDGSVRLVVAETLRERGTHVVWHLQAGTRLPAERDRAVDAYATSWSRRRARGRLVHRVVAALPSAGLVVAKESVAELHGLPFDDLTWSTALASVHHDDRREVVGGRRRPRPAVAAR